MVAPIYLQVATVLGLVMLAVTLHEYRKRKLGLLSLSFWSALWLGLVVTGLFPDSYVSITTQLGMNTPIQFVTSFSIVVIFVIVFETYAKLSSLDRKVAKLAQTLTIEVSARRFASISNPDSHRRRPRT